MNRDDTHLRFWQFRTFQVWLCGYIVILLLQLAVPFAFIQPIANKYAQKNEQLYKNAVDLAAVTIDEKISLLCSIGNSLALNEELKKIKLLSLPYSAAIYDELHTRSRSLRSYLAMSDLYSYLYVYHKDTDCLLDGQRIYTQANQMTAILRSRVHMEQEDFYRLMDQRHTNDVHMLPDGTLLLLHTLNTRGAQKTPVLTLVIVINDGYLRSILSDTANGLGGEALISQPQDAFTGGVQETRITETEDSFVISRNSECARLCYSITVPKHVFLLDNRTKMRDFCLAMIGLFVVSAALCYLFTVRNYRPVRELSQSVQVSRTAHQDDFKALQKKVEEMLENEKRLNCHARSADEVKYTRALHRILRGRLPEVQDIVKAHVAALGESFIAVQICFDETAAEVQSFLKKNGNESAELILKVILDEAAPGRYLIWKEDADYACILAYPAEETAQEAREDAERVMRHLTDESASYFPSNLPVVYLGDAQTGLEGIAVSWKHALQAKEYSDLIAPETQTAVFYDPAMNATTVKWQDFDIMTAEREFIALMVDGEYQKGQDKLREIVSYYSLTDGMSLYVIRCHMFGVMNLMLNVLHEIEQDLSEEYFQNFSPVERLLSAGTMSEMETVLFHIVGELSGYQEAHGTDMHSRLSQIRKYILQHYSNVNLSVQMIADEFDISLTYLSRVFKKEYGIGLLECINQSRIEKSCELLLENPEETIASIASRVGFNSSQTFIRIFKRYRGVTPGQYRANEGRETPSCVD